MDRLKLDGMINQVSAVLAPAGYQCIEAEWDGQEHILRLYVDNLSDQGEGISLDGCVKATKLLEGLPFLDEAVAGAYTLEVSSPGVERPLRSRQDFERFVGQTVEVKLAAKAQDRKHGKGRLLAVTPAPEALVTLETARGPWQFPLATLQRASLVYDWNQH